MASRTFRSGPQWKRGLRVVPALILWAGAQAIGSGQELKFQELPQSPSAVAPASPGLQPLSPTNVTQAGGSVALPGRIAPVEYTAPTPAPLTLSYQLLNQTCQEFESALVRHWLEKPQAQVSGDASQVTVEIPAASGAARMTIDRKSSTIHVQGQPEVAQSCLSIVEALDQAPQRNLALSVLTPTAQYNADLITAVAQSAGAVVVDGPLKNHYTSTARIRQENAPLPAPQTTGAQEGEINPNARIVTQTTDEKGQSLTGPTRIQVIPELNAIIISGPPEDVEMVKNKIREIQQNFGQTGPKFRRIPVSATNVQILADTIQEVYDDNFADNLGQASVRAVQDPRGLLVIGREEAILMIENLAKEYDRPETVTPSEPGFKTYKLRFMSAADAKTRVDQYFSQFANSGLTEPGPAIPVITIADFRSNTLIVKGTKTNFDQVEMLLKELDVDESPATNMVQVFPLKNTLADTIARPLQDAINGQQQGAGQGFAGNQQQGFNQQFQNQAAFGGQNATGSTLRSPSLKLMTIDREGNKVNSGIMFDVRVTSNASNNSLIVSAPESAMPLIAALIEQIDTIPTVETQIKVFQIINGDAQTLLTTLQGVFTGQAQQQGAQGGVGGGFNQGAGGQQTLQLPAQSASATSGITLGNMRFAVDQRTNSIIVTGPIGDLQVVEALLVRLDEQAFNQRHTVVLRLSNAPVADVANSVNQWLTSRQTNIGQADPTFASRKFVIVQPEEVSNSLIVSALPEYLDEVVRVIERLDRRPPMLKIKVLLAEVNLSMLEEFGAEIGVQDSLLFDRGIGAVGFPFNQAGLGNNSDAVSLATRENLAGQSLMNLGVGRVNSDLGYGGLVLSAGNESINFLLRALQDKNCARILDKPHLMTIENQKATFQSGQTVARISGVTTSNFGQTNNIIDTDIGVIIGVTPRISQDGMIILKVDAQKSSLSAEGVPVFVGEDGTVIESPNINKTQIQTTIMARSGQTIVLSGMISETKIKTQRGAPYLSSLPLVGPLFRFESEDDERRELMLILTPYLVDSEEDLDAVNYDEMDRMHWCLADVAEVYGSTNYDPNPVYHAPRVFYPDADPLGLRPQEVIDPIPGMVPEMDGQPQAAPPLPGEAPQAFPENGNTSSTLPSARNPMRERESGVTPASYQEPSPGSGSAPAAGKIPASEPAETRPQGKWRGLLPAGRK